MFRVVTLFRRDGNGVVRRWLCVVLVIPNGLGGLTGIVFHRAPEPASEGEEYRSALSWICQQERDRAS